MLGRCQELLTVVIGPVNGRGKSLDLSDDQIADLARNSFTGSFLPSAAKAHYLAAIEAVLLD